MRRRRTLDTISFVLLFSFLLFGFSGVAAAADNPLDVVKAGVDEVVSVLQDPAYNTPERKDEQLEKIWSVIRDVFDFETIAKGTLRRHDWEKFSTEQQREFVDLFTDLIGNTYLGRLQSEYHDEKVVYKEQEMLSDSKAVVRTMVNRNSVEIPVDYRLFLKNGKWRVYNVFVENTSLVTNYRDQFSRILMRGTPADLLAKLREKSKEPERS